jgi:YVTN family beta-propeller protein
LNSIQTRKQQVYVILIIHFITLLSVVIYNIQVADAVKDNQKNTRPWTEIQNQNNSLADNKDELIPWFGFGRTVNITNDIANVLGMNEPDLLNTLKNVIGIDEPKGVLVNEIFPDSPAEKAGIIESNRFSFINGRDVKIGGDVIIKADNQIIPNRNGFEKILAEKNIDENLTLTIFRNGQIKEINVTATSKPGLRYEDASTYTNPSNINFSTYENIDLGIEIKYPLYWDIVDYETPSTVLFRSVKEDKDDEGREYLKLETIDNSFGFLKSINIVNVTRAQTLGLINYMKNLSINELPHNITFLNNIAAKTVYSYTDKNYGEVKILKIAIEGNGKIYLLTYYAQAKNYYNYLPTIEQMIDSLKLISLSQYENFDMGIRMEYPSNWNKTENNYAYSEATYHGGKTIELNPITIPNYTELQTGIKIYASDPYRNSLVAQEAFNETIKFYKNIDHLLNVKIILSNYSNNKNNPSYHISYTYGDPNFGILKTELVIIHHNERIYSIEYTGKQKEYPIYSQSINKIINSIEIFDLLFYSNPNLGIIFSYPSDMEISYLDHGIRLSSPILGDTLMVYKNENQSTDATNDYKSIEKVNETKTYIYTTTFDLIPANKTIFMLKDKDYPNSKTYTTQITSSFNNSTYIIKYNGIDITVFDNIIRSINIIDSFPSENIRYLSYKSPSGFNIKYPAEWEIYPSSDVVEFTNLYSSTDFRIDILPLKDNSHLYQYIESDIDYYSKLYRDFNFIESQPFKLANQSGYSIMFSGGDQLYMLKYIMNDVQKNIYIISTYNTNTLFLQDIQIIKKMIDSFEFSQKSKPRIDTGFKVGNFPKGVAVNEITNMVYVANTDSNTISVINGSNDETITNIPVSSHPLAVSINPIKNILYVTHELSGDLSVIDCKNNTVIEKLSINAKDPLSMAVNPKTATIYVADGISGNLSVIDGSSNKKIASIEMNKEKSVDVELEGSIGVAIDDYRNKVYVADPRTNNITVIDGRDNKILMSFNAMGAITDININSFRGKAYAIQKIYNDTYKTYINKIIEIDLQSNKLRDLNLNLTTNGLNTQAIHPFTNIIYATDTVLNKVYAINPSNDKYTPISVDYQPSYIAVNKLTDFIYVSNSGSNTISKINGNENVTSFGLKFFLNPSNSVFILCDDGTGKDLNFSHQSFVSYSNNVDLKCKARSDNVFSPVIAAYWSGLNINNSGFKFRTINSAFVGFDTLSDLFQIISGYWSGLWSKVDDNNPNPTININLNSYSVLSGTFITLSTLIQMLGPTLSLVILTTIVFLASIPSIVNKVRKLPDTLTEEIVSRADIITINASVIAGVLVFLSILEGFKENEQSQISFITATIVFPFAISAVLAITRREKFAIRLMIAGFINLMISVTLIALMRL